MEYATRVATPADLPRLTELFHASLLREGEQDPLVAPGGGNWQPCLRLVLQRKELLLLVLEWGGRVEGYALARREVMTGPRPRPSLLRLLLKLPRPRPVIAPFLAVWIDDIHLEEPARTAAAAQALGRALTNWARTLKAARIGLTIPEGREEARHLADHLGMTQRRTVHTVDL